MVQKRFFIFIKKVYIRKFAVNFYKKSNKNQKKLLYNFFDDPLRYTVEILSQIYKKIKMKILMNFFESLIKSQYKHLEKLLSGVALVTRDHCTDHPEIVQKDASGLTTMHTVE